MQKRPLGLYPSTGQIMHRLMIGVKADTQKVKEAGLDGRLTTEQVARWFKSRCSGLNPDAYEFPDTWGAAATESFAILTIGGDLRDSVATTEDEDWPQNKYHWYDFDEVRRGAIWRISSTGTLWLFKRDDEDDFWTAYAVPDFA